MNRKNWTARQKIERAFHVSFMLPDQASQLLDEYRDEVRKEAFEEASKAVRATPCPKETGEDRHWFVFALNRAADRLLDRVDGPSSKA